MRNTSGVFNALRVSECYRVTDNVSLPDLHVSCVDPEKVSGLRPRRIGWCVMWVRSF